MAAYPLTKGYSECQSQSMHNRVLICDREKDFLRENKDLSVFDVIQTVSSGYKV